MPSNFIFFISTGRCGTGLFSKVLNIKDDITSFHEHKPILNGNEMAEFLNGNSSSLNSKIYLKKNSIAKCKSDYYADTSHIFIKSWGWFLDEIISDNSKVYVVILKREKKSVIDSFSKIHESGLSESGKKWLFTVPKSKIYSNFKSKKIKITKIKLAKQILKFKNFLYRNKLIKHIKFGKFLKSAHFDSLDFHYEETYAMAKEYQIQKANFNYFEFDFDTMLNIDGFKQLFDFINKPLNKDEIYLINQILNSKVNDKSLVKDKNHKYIF